MTGISTIQFSSTDRVATLERLQIEEFDLLIIGGGITGAGIARDATLRGLNVAIIDKNDFAFGTSSRSSKMAHGGFRYLKNLQFSIVRESEGERDKVAPVGHLMVRGKRDDRDADHE